MYKISNVEFKENLIILNSIIITINNSIFNNSSELDIGLSKTIERMLTAKVTSIKVPTLISKMAK